MTRKMLVLNVVFLVVAALAVASIGRQILTSRPLPGPGKMPVVAAAAPAEPAPPPAAAAAYTLVASRNLFSPTRTETASEVTAAPIVAKPFLYGVVLRQGKSSVAYLEDPVSKRVSGYRIGDALAGGKLSAIKRDSVTIERGEGKVDVALRDPAKPRAAPATTAAAPGAAAPPSLAPGLGALPGLRLPVITTPGTPQAPQAPAVVPRAQVPTTQEATPPATPSLPGRRLPFNFLRRVPQAPTATQPPAAAQPPAPSAPQGQQD